MFPVYKNIDEICFIISKFIWLDVNINFWKLETAKKYLPFVPLHHACRLVFYCMDAGIIYSLFLEKTSLKHLFWKKTYKELHGLC